MQEQHGIVPFIFCAGVASMAQALMYINSTERGRYFSWKEFGSAVLLSGFIGFLISLAGDSYGLSTEMCGALAGLGGFAGKEGVGWAFAFIRKRMGLE